MRGGGHHVGLPLGVSSFQVDNDGDDSVEPAVDQAQVLSNISHYTLALYACVYVVVATKPMHRFDNNFKVRD